MGSIAAGVDHLLMREPAERHGGATRCSAPPRRARTSRARVEESAARVAALKAACTVPMPAPRRVAVAAGHPRAQGARRLV